MDSTKFFLNENNSKKSTNYSLTYRVNLNGEKRLYNDSDIVSTISAFEQYNVERKASNKVRLICEINPICTNILFNPITEIVKNEGSDDVICLNYTPTEEDEAIKPTSNGEEFVWNSYQAVRDTQLSNKACGYDYHCGIDIFNNHLLRNNTFKIVSYNSKNSKRKYSNRYRTNPSSHTYINESFNTIDDWLRDSRGIRVLNNFFNPFIAGNYIIYNAVIDHSNEPKVKDGKATVYVKVSFKDGRDLLSGKLLNVSLIVHISYEKPKNDISRTYERITPEQHTFNANQVSVDNDYNLILSKDIDVNKDAKNFSLYGKPILKITVNGEANNIGENKYIDENGNTVNLIYNSGNDTLDNWIKPSHLYQNYDIFDFEETIKRRLIEENGWFGFKNRSNLQTYDYSNGKKLDISKVINSKLPNTFIDMYPGRDLYSFSPKYNKKRHRLEKNWDLCITYPSSSTTKNIEFINENTGGLKILMFNDNVSGDDERSLITIYSIAQHGLKEGDYVNIYSNNSLLIGEAEVASVFDKYIFQIYKGDNTISYNWYQLESDNNTSFSATVNGNEDTYTKVSGLNTYQNSRTGLFHYVIPIKDIINLDETVLNLSFKKVENNVECQYYVRIFSRLPNFKYSEEEINDNALYSNNSKLIEKYSDSSHIFDYDINKLSFAKNIYGDEISEAVFTDDIDLSYLKDNLGRPLTDIYLTIIKRNKGYKEWYGIDGEPCDLNSDNVEFSHCFGKNTCAFRLSDDAVKVENKLTDIRKIGYSKEGLSMSFLNENAVNDEIDFDSCSKFYGDLCCYSPSQATETSIQPVMNRFNTAQREIKESDTSFSAFSSFTYDTIETDDNAMGFDDNWKEDYSVAEVVNAVPRTEGYYYQTHYKIPVKSVSSKLSKEEPIFYSIDDIRAIASEGNTIEITTPESNEFAVYQKLELYDNSENKVYKCTISKILTPKKIRCLIYNEEGKETTIPDFTNISHFNLVGKGDTIPSYARLLKDGSCRYVWREIIQNGFDNDSSTEVYPFTNDALYINRGINFYLRRQNPYNELNETIIAKNTIEYEPEGEAIPSSADNKNDNGYVSEENMKKC